MAVDPPPVAADRLPDPRAYPPELVHGELCRTRFSIKAACDCEPRPVSAAVSPAEPPEARAQAVQRGLEPAKTLLELVDAIRQDTAGIGACVSSIRFIASTRGDDVPKSVMGWVDRLAFHVDRLESKCDLALNGDSDG